MVAVTVIITLLLLLAVQAQARLGPRVLAAAVENGKPAKKSVENAPSQAAFGVVAENQSISSFGIVDEENAINSGKDDDKNFGVVENVTDFDVDEKVTSFGVVKDENVTSVAEEVKFGVVRNATVTSVVYKTRSDNIGITIQSIANVTQPCNNNNETSNKTDTRDDSSVVADPRIESNELSSCPEEMPESTCDAPNLQCEYNVQCFRERINDACRDEEYEIVMNYCYCMLGFDDKYEWTCDTIDLKPNFVPCEYCED